MKDCTVKELLLFLSYKAVPVVRNILREFLTVHQKHLKKLQLNDSVDLLSGLMELQLEELRLYDAEYSLAFLKQYQGLKSFSVFESHVTTDTIWELGSLEKLQLHDCWYDDADELNKISKLKNLKKLGLTTVPAEDVLVRMQLGHFEQLEELEVDLRSSSLESIVMLKRIAPNLNKLTIYSGASELINKMLETHENLESVVIYASSWNLSENEEFVCSNVKSIVCEECEERFVLDGDTVKQLPIKFPNVEVLEVHGWPAEIDINEAVHN